MSVKAILPPCLNVWEIVTWKYVQEKNGNYSPFFISQCQIILLAGEPSLFLVYSHMLPLGLCSLAIALMLYDVIDSGSGALSCPARTEINAKIKWEGG